MVRGVRRATLYTWSIVHGNDLPPFPERLPYVAALVDLEEGPRMMTNVVDCDFDALEIGMALEVVFQQVSDDEVTSPVVPARARRERRRRDARRAPTEWSFPFEEPLHDVFPRCTRRRARG